MAKKIITKQVDVAIVGGGPAGLAAAHSAWENGAAKVLIIERDIELGGILQQCIHNGFGLHLFKKEMTGPGYADTFIKMIKDKPGIEVMLDSMALRLGKDHLVSVVNPAEGLVDVQAKAVVLAMGCRERTRGAIRTPGARVAGVFSAGVAQRMVNIEGYLPGSNVVIVGSGDIGLIMARRLTLEGVKVKAVFEIMPHSNGLTRNIVQCLEDFGIPLYLSRALTRIHGQSRVTGVTHAAAGSDFKPVPGTEEYLECDCVLYSVGLIPENELSKEIGLTFDKITGGPSVDQLRQTSLPGFFAAGNVLHVHDLVDFVSEEGKIAGRNAALYARGEIGAKSGEVPVKAGPGIRSAVPQAISLYPNPDGDSCRLYLRAGGIFKDVYLKVKGGGKTIFRKKLPVARPSEMMVAKVPFAKLAAGCEFLEVTLEKEAD